MLIVDINALLTVNLLNLLDDILLALVNAENAQNIMRTVSAVGKGLTLFHGVSGSNENTCRVRNLIVHYLARIGVGDENGTHGVLLGFLNGDISANVGKHCHSLRLSRLEQFFNAGKTLRDIVARDTAGVEGTHRKLSTRLADGLSRDNADRLALVNGSAGGKVDAVALGTNAVSCLAGENASDKNGLYAVSLKQLSVVAHEHMVGVKNDFACFGVNNVFRREASVNAVAKGLDLLPLVKDGSGGNSAFRAAVMLADDNILRNIDHSAGKVAGVGGTKRGIGKTLSSASR